MPQTSIIDPKANQQQIHSRVIRLGVSIVLSDGNQSVAVNYAVTTPLHHLRQEIPTLAVLSDGLTGILVLHENVNLTPHESFLPLFAKIQ